MSLDFKGNIIYFTYLVPKYSNHQPKVMSTNRLNSGTVEQWNYHWSIVCNNQNVFEYFLMTVPEFSSEQNEVEIRIKWVRCQNATQYLEYIM